MTMRTFERDGMAHVEYKLGGARKRVSLGVAWGDHQAIATAIAKLFAGGTAPVAPTPSLEVVYTKALAGEWAESKDRTGIVGKWTHDVAPFFGATTPVGSITAANIDAFKAHLFAKGNSGKTVNRKLAVVSRLLHLAAEWDMIDKVPRIKRNTEEQGRVRWITEAEEATLLAFLRAGAGCKVSPGSAPDARGGNHGPVLPRYGAHDFADLCEVLIDTGLRLSEALRLEDRAVKLGDEPVVYVWVSKGGKPRTVPLTARAARILALRGRRDAAAHDTLAGSSRPFGCLTTDRCSQLWQLCRVAMGLEGDDQFVIHALRHTFAVRMIEAGNDVRVLQVLMGHAKVETTTIYAHVSPTVSRDAIDKLDARAGRVPKPTSPDGEVADIGRAYWIRTSDQRIKSPLLYQHTPNGVTKYSKS